MTETETSTASPQAQGNMSWVGYVVPMALFMVLTAVEGQLPEHYTAVYIAKAIVVTIALIAYRSNWKDLRPDLRMVLPGIVVGLLVCVEWVAIDRGIPYPHIGSRTALDPFRAMPDPGMRALFLAVRFYGLALMVPIMEELFWRSFLIRYATEPDFEKLPIGTFSWGAFWMVAAAFGLAHPEWLVAVICAVAYGLLLRQTRSLFACVVAHATTNLALGIYVLTTHDWRFW